MKAEEVEVVLRGSLYFWDQLTHQNETEFVRHRDPNERKKMCVVQSLNSRKIIDIQFTNN